MSWHKITLPIPPMKQTDPHVVEIGDIARERYLKDKPAGFGMLHASRGSNPNEHDTRFIYFSPVAYELCREEIGDRYTLEPCDVPARDEPGIIWLFGDPLVMGMLADKWEPEVTQEAEAVS